MSTFLLWKRPLGWYWVLFQRAIEVCFAIRVYFGLLTHPFVIVRVKCKILDFLLPAQQCPCAYRPSTRTHMGSVILAACISACIKINPTGNLPSHQILAQRSNYPSLNLSFFISFWITHEHREKQSKAMYPWDLKSSYSAIFWLDVSIPKSLLSVIDQQCAKFLL